VSAVINLLVGMGKLGIKNVQSVMKANVLNVDYGLLDRVKKDQKSVTNAQLLRRHQNKRLDNRSLTLNSVSLIALYLYFIPIPITPQPSVRHYSS
jgi:hypothetical protein